MGRERLKNRWCGGWVAAVLMMLALSALAHDDDYPTWMVKEAPTHYTVKEGDTLWSVSCRYLREPWRWEEIWYADPRIENPKRLYPGDRLTLRTVKRKPRLFLTRAKPIATKQIPPGGVVKLHPRIRVLPAENAIPTIPFHVIEPFLNQSRVITPLQAEKCPRIIALDEDHLVVGTGDHLYVSGLSPRLNETTYSVFRDNKSYIDPKTKAFLGIEGLVLGTVQLEQPGDPARLAITQSFAEIKIGDQIISTLREKVDPFFIPRYPEGKPAGQIISVFGGLNQISQYQILVITGGKNQGRTIGDVLAIYQTQKDLPSRLTYDRSKTYHFPALNIGQCVVFRVFDKVSYVLVMNATRAIYLLDEVGKP